MKKNILIHVHRINLVGGVEKVLYNLINNLDEEKYKVTILQYSKMDGEVTYNNKNIKIISLGYDKFSKKKIVKLYQRIHIKLAKHIIKIFFKIKKYDVAIAFQEGHYAKLIQGVRAKKKLLWIHNDMIKGHWTSSHFNNSLEAEKSCYSKFDNIVCVSNDVLESMKIKFGELDNLCVRYNPIDTNEISQRCLEVVEEEKNDKPLLVSVGRLCDQKGYDRLLRCVNQLNQEGYCFQVWIVGEGEDRVKLEKYIMENDIKNVKLLGEKRNPYSYMEKADWVICTSRHEGFNMVLHEATFIGKAILTTKNAGAKELLGNSEYGIIVENNEECIYQGMKKILDNNQLKYLYEERIKYRKGFIDVKERVRKIEELF